MSAPMQTIEQFAKERGLLTDADVLSHIHAGLRSAPTTKTYQRWNERETKRLQAGVEETRRLYTQAVEAGEIISPASLGRIERLRLAAAGHPDNEATNAAKRLLAKSGVAA